MQLHLERALPAPPAAVWPFIVDPARMNRWSTAKIEALSPGDDDCVGMTRRITIPGPRTVRFEEVIERAEAPHRLVYRVVRGIPVRRHRGEIALRAEGSGTLLTWDVDYEFPLPGVGLFARVLLERQLSLSLAQLAEVVRDAEAAPLPPARDVDDRQQIPTLRRKAMEILAAQRALADRLEAANDNKRWFARVYSFVTENMIALCDEGGVPHPSWVLRLIPRFDHYYTDNLRRYLGEIAGPCEAHWVRAFRTMDAHHRFREPLLGISVGLAKGVRAHIEEDLPRALAEIHVRHYQGRCAYARFRADYLSMRDVFRDASDRLLAQIPSRYFPLWMRVTSPLMTREMKDGLVHKRFYDVPKRRREAFERGERLANLLLEDRDVQRGS